MKRLLSLVVLVALSLPSCSPGNHPETAAPPASPANKNEENANQHSPCVNLNTATAEELMTLPGVGTVKAQSIIEYRERHGPFRRTEEIIIIDGFSERRYRALAHLICVE
ncbi:MAG: helix-hairpin-helix domain-containing protein [Blastocatellia bacterium]|nr:helix-hairpin-helix domain-containing protein [Blastocatellia bacterium]